MTLEGQWTLESAVHQHPASFRRWIKTRRIGVVHPVLLCAGAPQGKSRPECFAGACDRGVSRFQREDSSSRCNFLGFRAGLSSGSNLETIGLGRRFSSDANN